MDFSEITDVELGIHLASRFLGVALRPVGEGEDDDGEFDGICKVIEDNDGMLAEEKVVTFNRPRDAFHMTLITMPDGRRIVDITTRDTGGTVTIFGVPK